MTGDDERDEDAAPDDDTDDQLDDAQPDPDEDGNEPFPDLDPGEREGDPFDELGDPATPPDEDDVPPTVDAARSDAGHIGRPGDEGFAGGEDGSDADRAAEPSEAPHGDDPPEATGAPRGDDPLPGEADLPGVDVDVPETGGDPFASEDSVFQRVDVGRVDADRVWEQLTDEDWSVGDASPGDDTRNAVVSKHEYCEGCEFFSPPPEVECRHDRAEIVEFVDLERVRLKNCPIVARRRELERDE